ncbi:MAG: hypothetical protein WCV50_01425 [Patescibacteria group bacterium]
MQGDTSLAFSTVLRTGFSRLPTGRQVAPRNSGGTPQNDRSIGGVLQTTFHKYPP